MVFMRYDRPMKSFVKRIRELLDLRVTIFRAAVSSAVYKVGVRRGETGVGRPLLAGVVDQVLPPGTPLNPLAQILAEPGADIRLHLTHWIEEQLSLGGEVAKLPTIRSVIHAPSDSTVESPYRDQPLF
jgi:hypothetical protein